MTNTSDSHSKSSNHSSVVSSQRSSIDSSVSAEYQPETLHESQLRADDATALTSRRLSVNSRNPSRITTSLSRINSIRESIRDDNEQTYREERQLLATDAGVLRKEWTVNDALSQLEEQNHLHGDDLDEEQLDAEQEKNKNLGYTKEDLLDPPPDGGARLWICAVSVGLFSFSTWGINSAYGVFLSFYTSHDYFPGASQYDYAMIGSIVLTTSQVLAPFVIIFLKLFGYKETLVLGTIIQTASYIMASFATKTWHLYMTQGFLIGVSFSFIFVPASMIIPTWFLHRRGLANGIALCGSGLGGVVFSLAIAKIIEETGSQKWPLRMLAIVGFVVCATCTILTIPRNYKHPKCTMAAFKLLSINIFDISAWKEPSTILISVWFALANMGYTIVLFSVSSYAISVGLTSKQASDITAILNTGQTIGRPIIGLFADSFGRINFCIIGISILFIFLFAFWINAKTYGSLILFTFLSGFVLPIANTLNQPLLSDAIEPSRFPAAYSFLFILVGIFALPSEVIGMKLNDASGDRPYLYCQVFTGLIYAVCVLMLLPLRELKIRNMIHNRRETTTVRLHKLENGVLDNDETKSVVEMDEEFVMLQRRLAVYDKLLQMDIKGYCARTVYPIKA